MITSNKIVALEKQLQGVRKIGLLQRMGFPHHEFWPWWLIVIPVWPLWLWYGIRLRCATWFTTVNPAIEDGGFMGESKIKIMDLIPTDLKPRTQFIVHESKLTFLNWAFPFIAKPDVGGRGRKIKFINNQQDLVAYHNEVGEDYMLQEIINAPLEVGVFYSRIPSQDKGEVLSLTSKGFLKVEGDGVSTIEILMQKNKRSALQVERLKKELDLNIIPETGEEVLLEPLGNHCKGTIFIDENARITDRLNASFDWIANQIPGFYYGRFDLRVPNWEDLENGKNISILELNGLTSDPGHIFDPNYRLRDVFKTQYRHIKIATRIAKENLAAGTKATPVIELAKKSWEALKMM